MAAASTRYPWYKKEDTDAFFALFQNNIANFIVIAITMLGMGFPASIVYGQVLPGAAIAVMVGNFYYARALRDLRVEKAALMLPPFRTGSPPRSCLYFCLAYCCRPNS